MLEKRKQRLKRRPDVRHTDRRGTPLPCGGTARPAPLPAPLTPLLLQRHDGGHVVRQVEEGEHGQAGEEQRHLLQLHGGGRLGEAWPSPGAVGGRSGGALGRV